MILRGACDLLAFVNPLKANHVSYRIEHHRDDTIMVTYTLVGQRVEVDFFEDHIEYSVFDGNEDVLDDQKALFEAIEDFVRE